MNKLCCFKTDRILAITKGDKAFLYDSNNSIPLKSFKFKTQQIVDALMPSQKMLFTITR